LREIVLRKSLLAYIDMNAINVGCTRYTTHTQDTLKLWVLRWYINILMVFNHQHVVASSDAVLNSSTTMNKYLNLLLPTGSCVELVVAPSSFERPLGNSPGVYCTTSFSLYDYIYYENDMFIWERWE